MTVCHDVVGELMSGFEFLWTSNTNYNLVILPERDRPVERNLQIIFALQTEVEPRLSAHPGVFDGKKNFYTTVDLEFEAGTHEVGV